MEIMKDDAVFRVNRRDLRDMLDERGADQRVLARFDERSALRPQGEMFSVSGVEVGRLLDKLNKDIEE